MTQTEHEAAPALLTPAGTSELRRMQIRYERPYRRLALRFRPRRRQKARRG